MKNLLNLGKALNKSEQRSINGGNAYYCFIYSWSDLVECESRGGEIVYCAPEVECAPED